MRWSVTFLALLIPCVALAQPVSGVSNFYGGVFDVEFVSPNATAGRINCNQPSNECKPLNLLACSETSRDVRIRVRRNASSPAVAAGNGVIVWLQADDLDQVGTANYQGDCEYKNDANDTSTIRLHNADLNNDSPLVIANTVGFVFPTDTNVGAVTTADFLGIGNSIFGSAVTDVCTGTPQRRVYRLCFGIDTNNDDLIATTEPRAFARIVVDTEVPATPINVRTTALDGAIGVKADADDNTGGDLFQWVVLTRPAPADAEAPDATLPSDCRTWEKPSEKLIPAVSTSLDDTVNAPNGQPTEGCVYVRDEVGNESPPSPTFVQTPVDQCDFIECYPPGKLTPGCNAGSASGFAALVGLVAFFRRRRMAAKAVRQ